MLGAHAQGLLTAGGCVHIVERANVALVRFAIVQLCVGDLAPDVLPVAAAQTNRHFARPDTKRQACQAGIKGLHVANIEHVVFAPYVKGIAAIVVARQQFGNAEAQIGKVFAAPFKNQGAGMVNHRLVAQRVKLLPLQYFVFVADGVCGLRLL